VLLVAGPPALILVFRVLPPPVTPLMLIRLAEGHALRREWVAYEEIAQGNRLKGVMRPV
jgi:monofunctional glycosyltransferase